MSDNLITTDHNLPVQTSQMTVTASGNGVAAGIVQGGINIQGSASRPYSATSSRPDCKNGRA